MKTNLISVPQSRRHVKLSAFREIFQLLLKIAQGLDIFREFAESKKKTEMFLAVKFQVQTRRHISRIDKLTLDCLKWRHFGCYDKNFFG